MIKVNAVDSFCDLKKGLGNGEKKLYLTQTDSLDFVKSYLGINIKEGCNIYDYNSEVRIRIKGMQGFVRKENLQEFFNKTQHFYNKNMYRTDVELIKRKNQEFLNNMPEKAYFQIDCSISKSRIYIGSKDPNWFSIPSFSIPNKTKVTIINMNNDNELRFEVSLDL